MDDIVLSNKNIVYQLHNEPFTGLLVILSENVSLTTKKNLLDAITITISDALWAALLLMHEELSWH